VEGVLVVPAATGGDTSTPRAWLVQATVEGK
jgi:hypothetical protein